MVKVEKGIPTYIGECYVDVKGKNLINGLVLWLINESVFFVVEPMPGNVYRFFTKEEFNAGLRTMVNILRKELKNEYHQIFTTS